MINIYYLLSLLTIYSLLILISSIDYMTRLALLILVFILSGIIYMVLDFKFLGLTYIIVYVGAISILFLFVIMKTESGRTPNLVVNPLIKGTHKITFFKKAGLRLDLLLLFIVSILSLIYFIPQYSTYIYNVLSFNSNPLKIYSIYSSDYTTSIVSKGDIEYLGKVLYLEYPLIIILLGILLWVTLIGILRISQKWFKEKKRMHDIRTYATVLNFRHQHTIKKRREKINRGPHPPCIKNNISRLNKNHKRIR